MQNILKLIRIKHYIKNLIIFLPLFFAGELSNQEKMFSAIIGFVCFALVSSAVYIFNDYKDIEKDKLHPTKKSRPLASGAIAKNKALFIATVFIVLGGGIAWNALSNKSISYLMLYVLLNIGYSAGLKNVPIADISILATGFLLRLLFGAEVTGIEISKWLYLVVITGSFYMVLGKRKNEAVIQTETREVLKYYTKGFLEKNMYVCAALADTFYALWAIEMPNSKMIWTVPLFIVILMRYSLVVEGTSDGDPTEVILHDKPLIVMIAFYVLGILILLY